MQEEPDKPLKERGEDDRPPREVEPEIVGMEPRRPPAWRRFLGRLGLALALGLLGAVLALLGLALTLSVIGAVFGLPLLLLGLFLVVAALTLPLR